jgi:hypothetical protein
VLGGGAASAVDFVRLFVVEQILTVIRWRDNVHILLVAAIVSRASLLWTLVRAAAGATGAILYSASTCGGVESCSDWMRRSGCTACVEPRCVAPG